MVLTKAQDIPPDEADTFFIAEFTHNALKSRMDAKELTTKKIQEILDTNFQDKVFAYILVCEDGDLGGWLLLYKKNEKELVINPGEILGGFPIIGSQALNPHNVMKTLLGHAIKITKESKFQNIELILPISSETSEYANSIIEAGYFLKLTYNDMTCDLSNITKSEASNKYQIKSVEYFSKSELFKCYLQAFENGKAQFFKYQSNEEKEEYFSELYIEKYADTDLSIVILDQNKLIGFSFVLEFEPGIKHVSCMCVHPDYQGKGIGSYLIEYITKISKEKGARAINLGTEPQMIAYQLYKSHGFRDAASYNIYGWMK